jgi:hypothetical protein
MSALSAIIPRVTISFQLKLLTKKIRKKEIKNGRRRKTFNICILLLFYFHSISLHTIKRLFTACLQLCFIDKLNANIVFSSVRFQRVWSCLKPIENANHVWKVFDFNSGLLVVMHWFLFNLVLTEI